MRAGLLLLSALLAQVPPSATRAAAVPPARPAARPTTGTVLGTLRHKGCPTAAGGATVAVIGRDAIAVADAEGRFTLTLPPGTYSLVIGGPGLVADQWVDDVVVAAGQPHDLGTVEVWPEEPPPGCGPGAPPPPATAVVATVASTPTVDLPGASLAPVPVAPDQVWVRGGAGSAPGQFALHGDPARVDEDALGPPSFAVGPQGGLWVLDGLNGRVQRFDAHGRPAGSFALQRSDEPPLEADLAVADDGHVYVFHQNDVNTLFEYDTAGHVVVGGELPPSFKGVDLLFAGRAKPLFLLLNGQAVRAELGWGGIRADGPLPGLPFGGLYAHVERMDRWRVTVTLAGADGRVRRSVQLHSLVPVTGARVVGVGRRGELVAAIDRSEGDEATPRAEVLLVAVDQHGHVAGTARVPPGNRRFEFREFALAPDGAVIQMQSDAAEVRFVRWTLRPPPRDATTGEGLVRGRVLDGARSVPGAVVTAAGRQRRTVVAAGDGSFEVRLPAGTWVLSARRAGAPAADAPVAEVKVAVAAGATVDVGHLTLARPPPRPPVAAPVPGAFPAGAVAPAPGAAGAGATPAETVRAP